MFAKKAAKPTHRDGIRAEIMGSDRCQAEGFTVHSASPVLAMCRKLIEAEFDPDLPLLAYRGDVLCLSIRSIGEGARLIVKSAGNGVPIFAVNISHNGAGAPPVRQMGGGGVGTAHPRMYRDSSQDTDGADHAAHS